MQYHCQKTGRIGPARMEACWRLDGTVGWIPALVMLSCVSLLAQAPQKETEEAKMVVTKTPSVAQPPVEPDWVTEGKVSLRGQSIAYCAGAGPLTGGSTDPQDATLGLDGGILADAGDKF